MHCCLIRLAAGNKTLNRYYEYAICYLWQYQLNVTKMYHEISICNQSKTGPLTKSEQLLPTAVLFAMFAGFWYAHSHFWYPSKYFAAFLPQRLCTFLCSVWQPLLMFSGPEVSYVRQLAHTTWFMSSSCRLKPNMVFTPTTRIVCCQQTREATATYEIYTLREGEFLINDNSKIVHRCREYKVREASLCHSCRILTVFWMHQKCHHSLLVL